MNWDEGIQAAKADGVPNEEIVKHLLSLPEFKSQLEDARKAGHSYQDIWKHFGLTGPESQDQYGFGSALAHGATMGNAPGIRAALEAAGSAEATAMNPEIPPLPADYVPTRKAELEKARESYTQTDPVANATGEMVGGLASAMLGGAGANAVIRARQAPGIARFLTGQSGYDAAGRAIPGALPARMASQGAAGAIQGGIAAGTSVPLNDASTADQIATGAEVAGPVGAVLGPASNMLGNKLKGLPVERGLAELADWARKNDIPLRAGQVSNSPLVKALDERGAALPFSGRPELDHLQEKKFVRRLSQTFGEDTSEITDGTILQAKDRIGGALDEVAARTGAIHDTELNNALIRIQNSANALPDSERGAVQRLITDILDKGSTITGKEYQGLTNKTSPLGAALRGSNADIRYHAGQIREALDAALERHSPADMIDQLKTARKEYKNVLIAEDLVKTREPVGAPYPNRMQGRVNRSYGAESKAGALGKLSQIGRNFMNTSPREKMSDYKFIGSLLTGEALLQSGNAVAPDEWSASVPGGKLGVAAGLAAPMVGAGAINRYLATPGAVNRLVQRNLNPQGAKLGGATLLRLLSEGANR